MQVVATGEVHIETDKGVQKPNLDAIQQRAWRTCWIGYAACGSRPKDVQVELRPDDSGNADVQVLCSKGEACGTNDAALQEGLNRL